MRRIVIRAEASAPPAVLPLKFRIGNALGCLVLGAMAFVFFWSGPKAKGDEQFLSLAFGFCWVLGLLGVCYLLYWPRGGRLVAIVDPLRDEVSIPSSRMMRPLALLVLLGLIISGFASFKEAGWAYRSEDYFDGVLEPAAVVAFFVTVAFLRHGAETSRLNLNSDFFEFRSPFRSEIVEWRDITDVDLVAARGLRIRVVHFRPLEIGPGPFGSDPRLIVDLLRAVKQRPEVLDDLESRDLGSLLHQR